MFDVRMASMCGMLLLVAVGCGRETAVTIAGEATSVPTTVPDDPSSAWCERMAKPIGDTTAGALLIGPFGERREVEVFLDPDATADDVALVREELEPRAVGELRFVSQQEQYELFTDLFANRPEYLENVTLDILPSSFRLVADDPSTVAGELSRFAGVKEVAYAGQGQRIDVLSGIARAYRTPTDEAYRAWSVELDALVGAPEGIADGVGVVVEAHRAALPELEPAFDGLEIPATPYPIDPSLAPSAEAVRAYAADACGLDL